MRGSQHFIQADWKPRALGRQKNFLSIYLKYIQSCRTISVSPTGHPSQEIWRWPWVALAKTWGSRGMYKLFSDKHQQSGAREREGIKAASRAYVPEIQSVTTGYMCQTWSSRMAERPPSQKDLPWGGERGFSLLATQCPGVGASWETFLWRRVLWGPGMQVPPPPEPATKIGAPQVKNPGPSHIYSSPPGDTSLGSSRGRGWRYHPPSEVSEKDYSQLQMCK